MAIKGQRLQEVGVPPTAKEIGNFLSASEIFLVTWVRGIYPSSSPPHYLQVKQQLDILQILI